MDPNACAYLLVISTCPERDTARRIAAALVRERLAACVNVIDGVTSVYQWQERIHEDAECVLLIKTRHEHFDALQARVLELHPYELPELIAVPLQAGLPGYLRWIDDTVLPTG